MPNFQHPERKNKSPWNNKLDDFSFIVLDISLSVLADNPGLWNETQSGDDKVLFSAHDFAAPLASNVFNKLKRDSRYSQKISILQKICSCPFETIPSPDKLAAFNSEKVTVNPVARQLTYDNGGIPVVNAAISSSFAQRNGTLVEMVGTVTHVKVGNTKLGKPYAMLGFYRGRWSPLVPTFELALWEEDIGRFQQRYGISLANGESQKVLGKSFSVTGILSIRKSSWTRSWDNKTFEITNYHIAANDAQQWSIISGEEMKFRLGGTRFVQPVQVTTAAPVAMQSMPRTASSGGGRVSLSHLLFRVPPR